MPRLAADRLRKNLEVQLLGCTDGVAAWVAGNMPDDLRLKSFLSPNPAARCIPVSSLRSRGATVFLYDCGYQAVLYWIEIDFFIVYNP